jgi:hypothetical protein
METARPFFIDPESCYVASPFLLKRRTACSIDVCGNGQRGRGKMPLLVLFLFLFLAEAP